MISPRDLLLAGAALRLGGVLLILVLLWSGYAVITS